MTHKHSAVVIAMWALGALGVVAYVLGKIDFFSGFRVLPHHWYVYIAIGIIALLIGLLSRFTESRE